MKINENKIWMGHKASADDLELYIHIPFCIKKCNYCDFLSFTAGEREREDYLTALLEEIRQWGEKAGRKASDEYVVTSVFIGGGTPSILLPAQMKRILSAVHEAFFVDSRAEITIECNPGTLSREKLKAYAEGGCNRLSIGLQSADDKELAFLGRIHTWAQFSESFALAREAGFSNINVDLMAALPGQTLKGYEETLKKVMTLSPEHISAYSLIIEEGTPFYQLYGGTQGQKDRRESSCLICNAEKADDGERLRMELPDEETERRMYEATKKLLEESGYYRYEISNYAKEGAECRHNTGYWTGTEYIGIGLGASSFYRGRRFSNIRELKEYEKRLGERKSTELAAAVDEDSVENLSVQAQMEEFMFLGLRMTAGVSKKDFFCRFGQRMESVYEKVLPDLLNQRVLEETEDRYRLTKRGIDVSNYVLAEFLL